MLIVPNEQLDYELEITILVIVDGGETQISSLAHKIIIHTSFFLFHLSPDLR
jgi:hypothetical protein